MENYPSEWANSQGRDPHGSAKTEERWLHGNEWVPGSLCILAQDKDGKPTLEEKKSFAWGCWAVDKSASQVCSLSDIYICNETSIFFQAVPLRSLVWHGEDVAGTKVLIEFFTVLLTCSVMGRKEKLWHMGKAKQPYGFQKYTVDLQNVSSLDTAARPGCPVQFS